MMDSVFPWPFGSRRPAPQTFFLLVRIGISYLPLREIGPPSSIPSQERPPSSLVRICFRIGPFFTARRPAPPLMSWLLIPLSITPFWRRSAERDAFLRFMSTSFLTNHFFLSMGRPFFDWPGWFISFRVSGSGVLKIFSIMIAPSTNSFLRVLECRAGLEPFF